jgi:hypothetical protein
VTSSIHPRKKKKQKKSSSDSLSEQSIDKKKDDSDSFEEPNDFLNNKVRDLFAQDESDNDGK